MTADNNQNNCKKHADIQIYHVDHVKLKLLISENYLILMNILKIIFIAENIINTSDKCVNSFVDCFKTILDFKVKFRKKLISVNLMMIEFLSLDEVF